jgi:hypothetical protein
MKLPNGPDISDLLKDSDKFMKAVNKAVQNTLRVHKLLGQPVVVWRDGQVVWVPPEEIVLTEESNGETPKMPML